MLSESWTFWFLLTTFGGKKPFIQQCRRIDLYSACQPKKHSLCLHGNAYPITCHLLVYFMIFIFELQFFVAIYIQFPTTSILRFPCGLIPEDNSRQCTFPPHTTYCKRGNTKTKAFPWIFFLVDAHLNIPESCIITEWQFLTSRGWWKTPFFQHYVLHS